MRNTLKYVLTCLFGFFVYQTSQAQIKDIASMLSGSQQDAEKLFTAYLKPYSKAFGADLNGGWYNTAKTHKLGGFDLTFSISAAMVPSADKTYNIADLNLQGNPVISGNAAPTVAGASSPGPTLEYKTSGITYAKFNTPKGTGLSIIPAPMLQLGIGLIKETDVTVRYLPNLNVGDYGGLKMWGVGVKHSLKQWIPGIKYAPFFHFSFFGGYTQLKTNANINFKPGFYTDALNPDPIISPAIAANSFDNQKLEMSINGLTFNLLASFDLPVITFYGGIGLSHTTTSLKLVGDYPLPTIGTTGSEAGKVLINSFTSNPVSIDMKSSDGSTTKPRLNGGIKFKFAVITLHFDYTYANYSIATAGLGISFR
jgi:hypothetical protein